MSERGAVLVAVLSSALGGMSAAFTRFLVGAMDPATLAVFRYGGGFIVLLPLSLALRSRRPHGKDWVGVAGLGLLFFAVFPVIYNLALAYTTAARGALALSTLPLTTMLVAAALGVEGLTRRKAAGVLVATGGVAFALASGLASSPAGAWRGDLLMLGGTFCMALYNVWSRPFITRSSPVAFTAASMGAGAAALMLAAGLRGGFAAVAGFGAVQWLALAYLCIGGGAGAFFLWVLALEHTTPTRVATTMTVNPIVASLLAAVLIGEPIGLNLLAGVAAIFAGIGIASAGVHGK